MTHIDIVSVLVQAEGLTGHVATQSVLNPVDADKERPFACIVPFLRQG